MPKIYFHYDKYAEAIRRYSNYLPRDDMHGSRHKKTGKILINIHNIINVPHGILNKLDFDNKISLCISHEVLHDVLTCLGDSVMSNKLDNLTVKYWDKGVDISTNLEV